MSDPRDATDEEWNEYVELMIKLCKNPCCTGEAMPRSNKQAAQLVGNPEIGEKSLRQLLHAVWLQLTLTTKFPVKLMVEQILKNMLTIKHDFPTSPGKQDSLKEIISMVLMMLPAYLDGKGVIADTEDSLIESLVKAATPSEPQREELRATMRKEKLQAIKGGKKTEMN